MTGTFGGLTPVASIDGRELGLSGETAAEGSMAARLRGMYNLRVEAEVARGRWTLRG